MKNRPRILVLLKTLGVGGAETLVLNSTACWDTARFDYRVGYMGAPHDLEAGFEKRGFPPVPFSPLDRANDPMAGVALGRYLRSEQIDLVHAHLPLPALWAGMAVKGTRTAVVATSHCEPGGMRRATALIAGRAWPLAHAVIAVGAGVARTVKNARRVKIIQNGIDLRQFDVAPAEITGIPSDAPVVLFLGSLTPVKRPLETLQVFEVAAKLTPKPDAHFLFAGAGPLEAKLRKQSGTSPLKDRLHLLGQRHDVPALVSRADIVCLLSVNEGLPMALLEGAAGQAALIGPKSSSAAGDLIVDNETGYAVDTDPEAAARIAELLKNPALCERLGGNARRRVEERFSLEENVRRTENLYREVLEACAE